MILYQLVKCKITIYEQLEDGFFFHSSIANIMSCHLIWYEVWVPYLVQVHTNLHQHLFYSQNCPLHLKPFISILYIQQWNGNFAKTKLSLSNFTMPKKCLLRNFLNSRNINPNTSVDIPLSKGWWCCDMWP